MRKGIPDTIMNMFFRHIALPALAPAALVALYFTPKSVFGCANRGLMALTVVLISAVAAFVTIGLGARARARQQPSSGWWLVSTLIFVLPIILILGPLR